MSSLDGIDLLSNPSSMGGMSTLETIDIPTISFDDAPPPPPGPKLVPSFEETGPVKLDGFDNFNAEAFAPPPPKRMSEEVLMKEKYEILRKFERLSKLGVPMRKRFTIDSPLEEMKMELEFIKREKSMDNTIKQFSEWFVTGMSGLEWGSKNVAMLRAFGLQLDGLSEAAQMNVIDLEDDFEELYELYGENMKMHPLVRIPLRTCMMIYMVHLTNQMTRKAPIPNIDEIMRQNPDIARSLAAAAMQNQTAQMRSSASIPAPTMQPAASNPLGGLMSFMQQGMPPAPPPNLIPKVAENKSVSVAGIPAPKKSAMKPTAPPPPTPVPVADIKPPTNIDDLLKDIKASVLPPVGNGPPPPQKIKKGSAGSTGKNSVVIKL